MTVKNPDGSEQTPSILANFDCLQQTGDFCSNSGPGAFAFLRKLGPEAKLFGRR